MVGAKDLRDCANDLRRAKGNMRRELTTAVKRAADPTLREVKNAIETLPIRGQRLPPRRGRRRFTKVMHGTGIRRRISRVVEVDVATGSGDPRARFVVRTARLGDARNVPWHLDRGRLRHPIMGNRNAWANQFGKPWFYVTIRASEKRWRREVDQALERVRQQIERGR
jgi:hypothetical protein